MKIHNPANGTVITDVDVDTSASVRAKYHRARAAQPDWSGLPIKKRLATIARFRERLAAMHEVIATLL